MRLPRDVRRILKILENNGHSAYVVGGCVRDALMGCEPQDWDICTSALPQQTKACFEKFQVIETGLKHGTLTLVLNQKHYEITTFRIDGQYTDNRRPDNVEFVDNLKADLSRRDFTINAMAYNSQTGVVDYFGGLNDINAKIIRCVGDPNTRFSEDALRIMRAVRFSSVLGFNIEHNTEQAMLSNKSLLKNVANERIFCEFNKLLVGIAAQNALIRNFSIIQQVFPELTESEEQVATIASAVCAAPPTVCLRLAVLCANQLKNRYSQKQISQIFKQLKYDNRTANTVAQLVTHCDAKITANRVDIKNWLNILEEQGMRQLLQVKKALGEDVDKIQNLLDEIIEKKMCYSLKNLAVSGEDLIKLGVKKGAVIGDTLNLLLKLVIEEKLKNEKNSLIGAVPDAIFERERVSDK